METWLCLPLGGYLIYNGIMCLKYPLNEKYKGKYRKPWVSLTNVNTNRIYTQNEIDFRHFTGGFLNLLLGIVCIMIFLKFALKLW
jgi:hypothetical protein